MQQAPHSMHVLVYFSVCGKCIFCTHVPGKTTCNTMLLYCNCQVHLSMTDHKYSKIICVLIYCPKGFVQNHQNAKVN